MLCKKFEEISRALVIVRTTARVLEMRARSNKRAPRYGDPIGHRLFSQDLFCWIRPDSQWP